MANRMYHKVNDADPAVRAAHPLLVDRKVAKGDLHVATDLTASEALLSPSKPGPKTKVPGNWSGKMMPEDALALQATSSTAREGMEDMETPQNKLLATVAACRVQARRRADACNAALPHGTFWEKVDWIESKYGGDTNPNMDIRDYYATNGTADAEDDVCADEGDESDVLDWVQDPQTEDDPETEEDPWDAMVREHDEEVKSWVDEDPDDPFERAAVIGGQGGVRMPDYVRPAKTPRMNPPHYERHVPCPAGGFMRVSVYRNDGGQSPEI